MRIEYSISNREHNPTPGIYMGRRVSNRYYDNDYQRENYDYYKSKRSNRYYSRSRSRSRTRTRSRSPMKSKLFIIIYYFI